MRADSAVDPTKSENITVTYRRSARSSGGALEALGVVATQNSNGIQQLHTVPERGDAKFLQVLVRQAR
jgi:hypothetical protein